MISRVWGEGKKAAGRVCDWWNACANGIVTDLDH